MRQSPKVRGLHRGAGAAYASGYTRVSEPPTVCFAWDCSLQVAANSGMKGCAIISPAVRACTTGTRLHPRVSAQYPALPVPPVSLSLQEGPEMEKHLLSPLPPPLSSSPLPPPPPRSLKLENNHSHLCGRAQRSLARPTVTAAPPTTQSSRQRGQK